MNSATLSDSAQSMVVPVNVPEQAPLVSCYYLGDYERNGYDDSDFHVVYWDDIACEVKNVQYASTRYGGGWNYGPELIRAIPADVLARIDADRYSRTLAALRETETRRVMMPDPKDMPFGVTVRLTKDSRKGSQYAYAKGETGEVTGQYWFGTFYRNGYNTRNRSNGRLGLRMRDGRKVFVAMTVARLDCEPDYDRCEANARALASGPFVCPGAWWTNVNEHKAS